MTTDQSSTAVLRPDEAVAVEPQPVDNLVPDSGRRRYNILHALFLSLFSARLYYDVAHHWKGAGIWYLVLVTFLSWLPLMLAMHFAMNNFVE